MRREGFELSVSRPRVLYKVSENGARTEPIEEVIIDVDDEPPVFVSEPIFSVEENQTQIGVVTVTDSNSSAITLSISGSEISIAADGSLSFNEPPDFEDKTSYSLSKCQIHQRKPLQQPLPNQNHQQSARGHPIEQEPCPSPLRMLAKSRQVQLMHQ